MFDVFHDAVANATLYAGVITTIGVVATAVYARRRDETEEAPVEAVVEENKALRLRLDQGAAEREALRKQLMSLQRRLGRVEGRVTQKDTQIATLVATMASVEKGNSRLRHALNNVCTADAYVRRKARAAGLDVLPFPAEALLELDDEYGDRLREVMREFC